jgi:hypothetical protein
MSRIKVSDETVIALLVLGTIGMIVILAALRIKGVL